MNKLETGRAYYYAGADRPDSKPYQREVWFSKIDPDNAFQRPTSGGWFMGIELGATPAEAWELHRGRVRARYADALARVARMEAEIEAANEEEALWQRNTK